MRQFLEKILVTIILYGRLVDCINIVVKTPSYTPTEENEINTMEEIQHIANSITQSNRVTIDYPKRETHDT